jgi:hypothetical protein
VKAYKFLGADGTGFFSRFRWPRPADGEPGPWVESEIDPCRSGIHACRRVDLPFWLNAELYELELGGEVAVEQLKVVAPRGRLLRRIEAWDAEAREEFSQMCIARAAELATAAGRRLEEWAPPREASAGGPALMSFIAARIAEETGGVEAHTEERVRQSRWLAERLGLDD